MTDLHLRVFSSVKRRETKEEEGERQSDTEQIKKKTASVAVVLKMRADMFLTGPKM